jgi:hypothetical protein
MASAAVPFKTSAGQAELSTRQRRVSQRHRTVLFLIDGKRSAAEVCRMALLAGVPESCFDELLAQGLIALPVPLFAAPAVSVPTVSVPTVSLPAVSLPADVPAEAETLHVDLPLRGVGRMNAPLDSILPPSRTLQPESTLSAEGMLDEARGVDPWAVSRGASTDAVADAVAEARELLMNAVRTQAPVAGSLTLLRLRRAGSRAELAALLGEVEARLNKPHRSLVAAQILQRVRARLGEPLDSTCSPA